ncbi:hypothetical protein [Coprobacter tertius]|uniref:Uncharacterized protein n=1 Tax=Coprobacter tertius TaxID=2944915 RepID=A0ABT1MJ02_9BACT|nr:hypothetical protein [Coprobacter tertius]MCP9612359.1 hypothetical protein [Coprobacter tertius]
MGKDKNILKQFDRKSGFKVPEGYFESFNERLMQQLPEQELNVKSVTLWDRIKPFVYMAAMFAGIALMIRLFVTGSSDGSVMNTGSEMATTVSPESLVDDYILYTQVDDYSLYEYWAENIDSK